MNCEGDCIHTHGEHAGEVVPVIVKGYGMPWDIHFNYCANAIAEDLYRGFTVDIVDPDEDDDEERGNNPPAEPDDEEFDILEPALG